MESPVIPGRIQMEQYFPVECFRKKGNTFRGIPLSAYHLNGILGVFFGQMELHFFSPRERNGLSRII